MVDWGWFRTVHLVSPTPSSEAPTRTCQSLVDQLQGAADESQRHLDRSETGGRRSRDVIVLGERNDRRVCQPMEDLEVPGTASSFGSGTGTRTLNLAVKR